jgi:hypothetical protein
MTVTADKRRITRAVVSEGPEVRYAKILRPAQTLVVPAGIEPATFRV